MNPREQGHVGTPALGGSSNETPPTVDLQDAGVSELDTLSMVRDVNGDADTVDEFSSPDAAVPRPRRLVFIVSLRIPMVLLLSVGGLLRYKVHCDIPAQMKRVAAY